MNKISNFQRNKHPFNNNELNEAQINQRLKNINLTKRLISYERYISAIPKNERSNDLKNGWHPETPRINKHLSLSQWNKEVKKWRKQVHAWGNISEEVHKYICSLSSSEKYNYLSNLKLPELSQSEIKNLKKKNEEISDIALRNILFISDKKNPDNCVDNIIIDKPLFFLPQNFNGTILNNEFIIIKQNYLEKSLFSLKNEYDENYEYLFEKYYRLYFLMKDFNLNNENREIKTNDIIVISKKKEQSKNNNNINAVNEYMENQKIEASKYLYCSSMNTEKKNEKKKRRF
ncbi:histone RNA hairpin-binding protein, putative [Plasmodium gallinaceum]|uniref:Histone RNA hairpin-binding protein, putative n=1 Tax=Plasmodium gallinaceum TaxID=5849 RepID=A0A1J1GKN6_PLAGA|nr:histone RNA hairpin-binding protein, putative [Plasmodium gallinaceum]CRG92960.1 histone RNA hairpin-binding protein, putative [Plasmodium gallinaceum]